MRSMRSNKSKSRGHDPPTHDAPTHSSQTNHQTSIELTTQRKRDLLASVGFLEQDEELPQVQLAGSIRSNKDQHRYQTKEEEYYHEKEERRRRKQQMKNSHRIDFDEFDFHFQDEYIDEEDKHRTEDEDLSDNSDDEYSLNSQGSNTMQSSKSGIRCNIATKLVYVLAMVAAFIYIFGDDSSNKTDEKPIEHEYYSYQGYKDARMPDDDQYGGGSSFQDGVGSSDNSAASSQHGIDVKSNIDTTSSEHDIDTTNSIDTPSTKHETGVPNEESIWQNLSGYADLSEPYNPDEGDIAFFWHVPKCGGTTLQDLMMHCMGMVGANEVGGAYANDNEPLQIVQMENGNRYVNVDVTQVDGIQHALDMGFASSGLADVALSSRFHNVASLFLTNSDQYANTVARGRCFALLRHPVKRAISMFYYLRDATWEHTYSEVYKSMTIEEYAVSQYAEDNWMVRFLTNEMSGILNDGHLDLAKQILQSKCLVGLLEEFPQSVKRFNRYFGWDQTDFQGGPVPMSDRGMCVARVMSKPDNVHEHPNHGEGSEVWVKLMEKNVFDIGLYEHAVELFHSVQVKLVGD
ncbi:hypothetical protein ACHAWO_002463 [Cyclotella atomus]|uniref:Sulfotransferase domain-containing protein n=1 Tax=Cyclotella atomus TaxID=382360 RepID=A0ABD3QSR7_9STRA